MARKTRYVNYVEGMKHLREKEKVSTPKSVLEKLKTYKNQDFSVSVPIGGSNGAHLEA